MRIVLSTSFMIMYCLLVANISFAQGDSIFKIEEDGNIGYINRSGEVIINPIYKSASDFSEGLAAVRPAGYYGYIDKSGKLILPPKYDFATSFVNGIATVYIKGQPFCIDKSGNSVINDKNQPQVVNSMDYHKARAYHYGHPPALKNNCKIVRTKDRYGIVDTNGAYIIPPTYEAIYHPGEVDSLFFFRATVGDKYMIGIANLKNEIIVKPMLDQTGGNGFKNGLVAVLLNGRFTYINTTGDIIWQKKTKPGVVISDMNTDYMRTGDYVCLATDTQPVDSDPGSKHKSYTINNNEIEPNEVSVTIDMTKRDTLWSAYNGYTIYVANTTKKSAYFLTESSRVYMKMQALDEDGEWKDIELRPGNSGCGNSRQIEQLRPGTFWNFTMPKYEGAVKTKGRLALMYLKGYNPDQHPKLFNVLDENSEAHKEIYSNIIDISINPAQFWNQDLHWPLNVMEF